MDEDGRRRHLEAGVLHRITPGVERYRGTAEERFRRLDALLVEQDLPTSRPRDATNPGGAPS